MAARRRRVPQQDSTDQSSIGVPAQQDEADIIEEVDAERDAESGDLMASEDKIRELGAVDAASVIENRRLRTVVNRKRNGEKGVRFNAGDLLTQYDTAVSTWPPNTFDITMRRLTGTPVTHVIMSRPRSGVELYEAIKVLHGQYEEAEYEIVVKDRVLKQFRVNGRITLPDTRVAAQQGQPMNYPPPGYPPQYAPPGYPPPQQQQQGYPPPQQQQQPGYPPQPAYPQAQPQPAPQPAIVVQPAQPDPMAMMTQLFQLMQQMQASTQPQPQPQPQQAPAPVMMPPPPPASADPAAQMAWMQGAVQLVQQMQEALRHPAHSAPQPQPQQPPPVPPPPPPQMMGPTRAAPAGMQWIWEPGFGFVLTPAQAAPPQGPPRGPMYRGPRAPYYPQGDQDEMAHHAPPPPPPPPPRSLADQWRESLGVLRTARNVVQEMNTLMPGYEAPAQEATVTEEDDSPIRIQDAGPVKLALNKEDGSLRWAETGMMALPGVLKWIGEQADKIQQASAERQRAQQAPPQQQLPPGYVEVGPGYQPPPGFVAVPVEVQQQQSPLPPPPEHLPPPVRESVARQAWGAPAIPDQGEEQ